MDSRFVGNHTIWLGVQWIQAGWHKLADGFDAAGFLQGAIAKAGGEAPTISSTYASFLEGIALPNVQVINVLIPWGEFLIGIALIFGVLTVPALIAAAFMNLNFLWAGTISTNPTYLLAAVILLFAAKGAMYWGIDRYLMPVVKGAYEQRKQDGKHKAMPAEKHA